MNVNGQNYTYCTSNLNPGSSCVVRLRLRAASTGPVSAVYNVPYTGGPGAPLSLPISATLFDGPYLGMSPYYGGGGGGGGGTPTHDMGNVPYGSPTSVYFKLQNYGTQGTGPLSLAPFLNTPPFSFAGGYPGGTPGAFDSQTNMNFCPTAAAGIPAGQSCVVKISFTSFSVATFDDQLSISYSGPGPAPAAVYNLHANVFNGPLLSLQPLYGGGGGGGGTPTFNVGDISVGAANTDIYFKLSNNGNMPSGPISMNGFAHPSNYFFYPANPSFPGGLPNSASGMGYNFCPTLASGIPAGTTCLIHLQFYSNTAQTVNDLIRINYSGGPVSSADYNLTANSTTAAILHFYDLVNGGWNGGTFDFGTAGTPITGTILIRNDGLSSATVATAGTTVTLPGGFAWPTGSYPGIPSSTIVSDVNGIPNLVSRCDGFLAAGSYCAMKITFYPTGTTTSNGNLSIPVTSGLPSTLSRNIMGTGILSPKIIIREDGDPTNRCNDSMGCRARIGYTKAGVPTSARLIVMNVGSTLEKLPMGMVPTISQSWSDIQYGSSGIWPGQPTPGTIEVPYGSGIFYNLCDTTGDFWLSPGDACAFETFFDPWGVPDNSDEYATISANSSAGSFQRTLYGSRCEGCF